MKKVLLFVTICVFAFSIPALAKPIKLEMVQYASLSLAYKYGQQIIYKGERWGETAASICWQESKGSFSKYTTNGVVLGDMNSKGKPKSLGGMQVQGPAARDVEKWYPIIFKLKFGPYTPTDEELIIALLTDLDFNIQVGVAYFRKMLELKNGNWSEAILAYNRGSANDGQDPNDYVRKVKHWRKTVIRPFLRGEYEIKVD